MRQFEASFVSSSACAVAGVNNETHKVRTYTEYHSVRPSSELGLPPTPHPQASLPPPPCFWGEGNTRWRERGWESPNSDEGHTLWYSLYVRTLWWDLTLEGSLWRLRIFDGCDFVQIPYDLLHLAVLEQTKRVASIVRYLVLKTCSLTAMQVPLSLNSGQKWKEIKIFTLLYAVELMVCCIIVSEVP